MSRAEALKKLQDNCGYVFKNPRLLEEALTHDSNRVNDRAMPNYQRLEFLGDRVLSLVVSDYLFRNQPEINEGQLTNKHRELTEAAKQVQIAERLNIKEHILFGQSVRKDQFLRYHSFVESLIGAVYIDGELGAARNVIYRLWELSDNPTAPTASTGCVIS